MAEQGSSVSHADVNGSLGRLQDDTLLGGEGYKELMVAVFSTTDHTFERHGFQ
jgi:hypothetical protein